MRFNQPGSFSLGESRAFFLGVRQLRTVGPEYILLPSI